MANFRNSRRKKPLSDINVVPYIDVMLVLLVIFMITAPLLSQGIHVNLPRAAAKTLSAKDNIPIVVSVDSHGKYYLNISKTPSQPIQGQALMSDVSAWLSNAKEHKEILNVYVKGDRNVDYGKVVHAMVLLKKAGAENVGLITQPNG